jgi:hypothetical protein
MKQLSKLAQGAAPRNAASFAKFNALPPNYNSRPRKRSVVLPGKESPLSDAVLELNGGQSKQPNRHAGIPAYAMDRGEMRDENGACFKIHPRRICF